MLAWLQNEYRDIAKAMGFEETPIPKFRPLALGDEIREKQVLASLVDKAIVSRRTIHEALGFDPETELARMRDEKGLIDDEIYPPRATSAQKSGGRPVGDSGKSYAPDRKPTLQKRIKGKAVTEEETEILLSVESNGSWTPTKEVAVFLNVPFSEIEGKIEWTTALVVAILKAKYSSREIEYRLIIKKSIKFLSVDPSIISKAELIFSAI